MLKPIVAAIAITLAIGSMPAFAKVDCANLCDLRCKSSMARSTCTARCLSIEHNSRVMAKRNVSASLAASVARPLGFWRIVTWPDLFNLARAD